MAIMSFADMLAEVTLWTKRPDLTATSGPSAIRGVTLKYHRKYKFFKDLVAIRNVVNPTPGPTAVLDIPSNFPNWRQFKSIKPAGQDRSFVPADPDRHLDPDGYSLNDVYLVVGNTLNIKSYGSSSGFDVIYYSDPVVWPAVSYSSWIANEQPDLIIAGAAARILSFDNESEIFKTASIEEAGQLATLVASNLEEQGR